MAMDLPQPIIFNAWIQRFEQLALARNHIPPGAARPWADMAAWLLSPPGAAWCGGDCGPLLDQALREAIAARCRQARPRSGAWRWGDVHVATFADPVLPSLTQRIPQPGDDTTIFRGGSRPGSLDAVHGPGYRGVYDLADLDRSRFIAAPGQSGNPLSRHARDLLRRWRDGGTVTLGPDAPAVDRHHRASPAHRRLTDSPAAWTMRRPMTYKPPRRPQFFYTTAPLPCPYVSGRTERKVVTEITGPDSDGLHDRLSRAGFRRSHNIAYAPVCPSCNACVPIRIPVATFQPDRTLRRIARYNAEVDGFEVAARATAEQFQLFQRYQLARHGDGDMATMSFYDYRAMVEDTPIETSMIEFRDADDRLVGGCLTDRLGDGLSAVYSFFAPELERRSLGNYAILWLIERARVLGLPYVYLGYWVPESAKMAYKARFRPSEILAGGAWRVLKDADQVPMPAGEAAMVSQSG